MGCPVIENEKADSICIDPSRIISVAVAFFFPGTLCAITSFSTGFFFLRRLNLKNWRQINAFSGNPALFLVFWKPRFTQGSLSILFCYRRFSIGPFSRVFPVFFFFWGGVSFLFLVLMCSCPSCLGLFLCILRVGLAKLWPDL